MEDVGDWELEEGVEGGRDQAEKGGGQGEEKGGGTEAGEGVAFALYTALLATMIRLRVGFFRNRAAEPRGRGTVFRV